LSHGSESSAVCRGGGGAGGVIRCGHKLWRGPQSFLRGRDAQLEAAMNVLKEELREGKQKAVVGR